MGYVASLGLWQAFREAPHSYSGFKGGKKSIVGAGQALPEDGAASGAATNPQCETGNAHSKRWRA